MNVQKMCTRFGAAAGAAALVLALGACSHAASTTTASDSGEIRTQGQPTGTTAAVMSGPAVVDQSGNIYSSSAAGGAGNAASVGNNTNVQVKPETSSSAVTYAETTPPPAPAPTVVETPAPAPVVVETPAPAPTVVETPMASSTETTETHHRRLHKD
jgi:hypothetical protein